MRDHHTPDEIGNQVAAILANLAYPPTQHDPIPTSLEYERWVEQPRRRGIDPVWQSLLTQALADNPQPIHRKAG